MLLCVASLLHDGVETWNFVSFPLEFVKWRLLLWRDLGVRKSVEVDVRLVDVLCRRVEPWA